MMGNPALRILSGSAGFHQTASGKSLGGIGKTDVGL
jgi:hypothetical protein